MMINLNILEKIREAQRLAEIEQIKANAIIINKNFIKTPKLYVHNKGTVSILPPMICGLEMYFTDNELPDNYSFAILDAGQTERDRLVNDTKYEITKEILEGFIKWLNQAISESYDKSVKGSIHYGGKNSAFHEVKELVKKVAKARGVEVE